jgi:molybdate transport system substrate-binding protein
MKGGVLPRIAASLAALCAMGVGVGTASAEVLRVSAAASLTEAFSEAALIYERTHAGDRVELNFAGSQVLRTQIEQGAPADVFASADLVHADALVRSGLLGPTRVFARNRVVVVAPAGEGKLRSLQDLARPGLKLVLAASTVPVGRYTTQVLGKLGAAGLYGDDFQARVQANVVSQETNARAVLAKVALGEADAGFVYATDAATSDKVRMIDVPQRYNVVAEYPIGVLTKSPLPAQAKAFVELVLGAEGQAILRKRGFAP